MDRKRRLSHRLRENRKPKFKNTAGTTVDLEDDDDFVSPPKETKLPDERVVEISSGPTTKKGKEKRQTDLRDEEYASEPEVDIDEMVKDFADEEAFCAIVDIRFKKILKEKENMEIALSTGLAKFPKNEMLISWKNKITQMFYGETDSEDIESHDKGNENWNDETYESPKKKEENEKVEDEIQPDDLYKTLFKL
ncbi:hypothetical protein L1887_39206 [Cichorium endivia]|nr:hypothetical protein L1887_39206 [Cichorium endivia]